MSSAIEQQDEEAAVAANTFDARNFFISAKENIRAGIKETKGNSRSIAKEIEVECFQVFQVAEVSTYVKANWLSFFHIPYIPALHKPGWLTRYIVGPHTGALFEAFFSDFWAGITVALTLIPQVRKIRKNPFSCL